MNVPYDSITSQILKYAHIIIIKKSVKKPEDEVKSYGPISLLPKIGKCIEKIVKKRLVHLATILIIGYIQSSLVFKKVNHAKWLSPN